MFTILVYSISPKFMQDRRKELAVWLVDRYDADWLEVSDLSIRIPKYDIQILFRYGDIMKLHGMRVDYYYTMTGYEMPALGKKLDTMPDVMRCIYEQTETKRAAVSG